MGKARSRAHAGGTGRQAAGKRAASVVGGYQIAALALQFRVDLAVFLVCCGIARVKKAN